jgi:hypothetical protein
MQIISTNTHRNGSGIGEGFGLVKFINEDELMLGIVFPVEGCGHCDRCEYFGAHTLSAECEVTDNGDGPSRKRNGRVAVLSLTRHNPDDGLERGTLDTRFGYNSFDGGYFEGALRSAFKDPDSEARFLEYIDFQPTEEDLKL